MEYQISVTMTFWAFLGWSRGLTLKTRFRPVSVRFFGCLGEVLGEGWMDSWWPKGCILLYPCINYNFVSKKTFKQEKDLWSISTKGLFAKSY